MGLGAAAALHAAAAAGGSNPGTVRARCRDPAAAAESPVVMGGQFTRVNSVTGLLVQTCVDPRFRGLSPKSSKRIW